MSTDDDIPSRAEALERLGIAGRRLSDAVVLFHSRAAEAFGRGASETKTKTLGVIQRFGPMTHRDLTEHVGLKPASVSNILDRLEAKGWIRRQRSSEDARSVLVTTLPEKTGHFRKTVFGALMARLQGVHDGYDAAELLLIADAFGAIAAAQEAAADDLDAPRCE